MVNFLKETTDVLVKHNKSWCDVHFIRTNIVQVKDIEKFKKSMDFEYDNGYGAEEIPLDLIVAGKDWWIERHEYDGSEWWEYKSIPSSSNNSEDVVLQKGNCGVYFVIKDEVK